MLQQLAQYLFNAGRDERVVVEEHLGHSYAVGDRKAVALDWADPEPWHAPDRVRLGTLSGLVLTLKANIDGWDLDKLMIICGPSEVEVKDVLQGEKKDRPGLVLAQYVPRNREKFHELDLLNFRLAVSTSFEDDEERERLLSDCAAFRFEGADVREEGIDGAGMSVSDKRTAVAGGRHKIEDPVYDLMPWRSFPEAGQQVTVPYLLVIQGAAEQVTNASLTDCGGGAWAAMAAAQVGQHVTGLCKEHEVPSTVVW